MSWRRLTGLSVLLCCLQCVPVVAYQNSVPATPAVPATSVTPATTVTPATPTVPARPLTIPRGLVPALRLSPALSATATAKPAAGAGAVSAVQPDEELRSLLAAAAAEGEAASNSATTSSTSDSARRQLLQKLEFDRRPSAILEAWADPTMVAQSAVDAAVSASTQPSATGVEEGLVPAEDPQPTSSAASSESSEVTAASTTAAAVALKQLQEQLVVLRSAVTRGAWLEFGQQLTTFSESERLLIYERLVASLTAGPTNAPRGRNGQRIGERNLLQAADVVAIVELYPTAVIPDEMLQQLGLLAATCENEGESPAVLAESLRAHLQAERPDRRLTPVGAGRLLLGAGRLPDALQFLPTLEQAQAVGDLRTLSVLATTWQQMHEQKSDTALLERAWRAVQAILESPAPVAATEPAATAVAAPVATDASNAGAVASATVAPATVLTLSEWQELQTKNLQLAVTLVPQLRKELGAKWLAESFTKEAVRGRRILSGIGRAAAVGMARNATAPDARVSALRMQQTAADAILQHAKDSIDDWKPALHLMLVNWLREARYSALNDASTMRGPQMQRDAYGNYFWMAEDSAAMRQMQMQSQTGMPVAIPAGKLLDAAPGDAWLQYLEPSYFPALAESRARLHLKVKEESAAFPWIEKLAVSHPSEAVELIQTFLTTWTENHDPNSARRRTGVYMFSFGYNERLNSIPLTRSHQERNLRELAEFGKRIRELNLAGVDESWLATAFAGVHSAAEVYLEKDLQAVFGSAETLQTKTLSVLLGRMRENLGSVWREPQVQQALKTNRRKQELEAEVLRGYEAGLQMCSAGLRREPANWRLLMVQGCLLHDLANYRNELARDAGFADSRREALTILRSAVDAYLQALPTLTESDHSVEPWNNWFYASLGDASLPRITQERNPVLEQIPLIEQSFANIPSEFRERHLDLFANDLFARMSTVNPAVKFRYVREGLRIAGERPQAREARQVFNYYQDLVQEIQLLSELDGSVKVGHGQPFGVLVSIRHSKAIEREGGGFARYLQNQNSGGGYYYNNGRPNEDYRDKFETAVRGTLDEHFEVLSVTFQPESVQSQPDAEDGWRRTPYAFLLLKARGPEIDVLPPLRLDLDFLDTTGYVVLPVESAAAAIDCSAQTGDPRPVEELVITQTLDEREFAAGKLSLEIRAVGRGIVPELEQVTDLKFANFEVTSVDAQPLSVSKFDETSARPAVLTERLWTVALQDRREAAGDAAQFQFASLKLQPKDTIYQRYEDADLKVTEHTVTLQAQWDRPVTPWYVWGLGGLILCAGLSVGIVMLRRRGTEAIAKTGRWVMPSEITPFTTLAVLQRIESEGGLTADQRRELTDLMRRIERHYFSTGDRESAPDLTAELQRWIAVS